MFHLKNLCFLPNKKKYAAAIKSIYDKNPLGFICGLVCPDHFCMKVCTRCKIDGSVHIPAVQASLIEQYGNDFKHAFKAKTNGLKMAVIGSGPAGIGAAWKLLQLGFEVEMFEMADKAGGCLNLIPEERLPQKAFWHDYQNIFGSKHFVLHLNTPIKKPEVLLEQGYEGVIVAVGTQNINKLDIEGEEHIVSYVDYLSNSQKYAFAKKIGIIGGGRVAADCALTAHKQKADSVEMIIRRSVENLRMSDEEKEQLKIYGVKVVPLTKVLSVQKRKDGFCCTLGATKIIEGKCVDNPDIEHKVEVFDLVIRAIGGTKIAIEENSKIICAGDCKNGATTVVEAVASGIKAAQSFEVAV